MTTSTRFSALSRVRDVLRAEPERGAQLLFRHGFDLGEGFVDVLSQWQTLEAAHRGGRLRDLDQLLAQLNSL